MKKVLNRVTAMFMAVVMLVTMVTPAFAAAVTDSGIGSIDNTAGQLVITNPDGTTEVVDESWEEEFPYGIFALGESEMTFTEGGETQILTVHRLGGTVGKASAIIYYQPAVTENEEGEYSYLSAISADDITIEVEDPLPITAYQAWGMPAEPEASGTKLLAKDGTDGEGNACTLLYIEAEAAAYEWYALSDGEWTKVEYAEGAELPVGAEELEAYDFRLVYTVDGVRYSTDSYKGVVYEKPAEEVLPEMPADLDLTPEKTYSTLTLDAGETAYSGWLFEVCFADGEYEKNIRITAKDDDTAELFEFATFTITGNVGADVHDSINTTMISITDNDEDTAEPAKIGFTVTESSFDKADGTAIVTVERTGGITNAVSVDWALEDGTALAGTDYADASGTLYFYGEQTKATIEIQLINDKAESYDEKEFTVKLSNLLGDDNAEITQDTFTVKVYNSDSSAELNLPSTLYDVDAEDISGNIDEEGSTKVSTGIIGGTQVADSGFDTLSASEKYATIDWGESDGTLDPLRYQYGKVTFPSGDWSSTVKHTLSVSGKGNHSSSVNIPNMGSMYKRLSSTTTGIAELASAWKLTWRGMEYTYSYFQYKLGGNTVRKNVEHSAWKDGTEYNIEYSTKIYLNDSWDYSKNDGSITVGLARYDAHDCENTITADSTVTLTRRYYDNYFYLDIYTANDEDLESSNVSLYTTDNYKAIQPKISFVSNAGGSYGGRMYVGSSFKVELGNTLLECISGHIINRKTGTSVLTGTVSGDGKSVTFSNFINDPSGEYEIMLVLDRRQNVKLSVVTSSEMDENGKLVNNAYENAAALFKSRVNNGMVTVKYSKRSTAQKHLFSNVLEQKNIDIRNASLSNGILSLISEVDVPNIQYINFNLPKEDIILFSGKAYAGNEDIKLETAHLTMNDILFYYYHEDYLTAQRPMQLTIDATAVYFDKNGNGQLDGYFDETSGVFILTEVNGVKDEFVAFPDSGDYEETSFAPYVDESGKVYQYFLRPYYTANPVCLVVPTGHSEDERMQVMPNFITDVTDSSTYETLTAEQKQYRTIVSGKTKIGEAGALHYSADDHYKYTAAASAYSYIDIPLGGDTNPSYAVKSKDLLASAPENGRFTVDGIDYMSNEGLAYYYSANASGNLGNAVYKWEPKYYGNLLYSFDNPAPINIAHSLAGDNIPITSETELWYLKEDGTWTATAPTGDGAGYAKDSLGLYTTELRANAAGAAALNEYLGAFTGNDTFALVVNEQKRTTDEIMDTLGTLADGEDEVAETVTRGTLGLYPNSEHLKQNGGSGAEGEADNNGQGEYDEFSVDAQPELFSFSSSAVGLLSVETDGYEVSFGFGIPVYAKDLGGAAGSSVNTFTDIADTGKKIGNFIKDVKNRTGKAFENLSKEDFDNKGTKMKSLEFTMTVSVGITLKYNPLDNSYKFSEAAIAFSAGIELRLSYRFTPVPIIYVYAQFGFSATVQTGLGREREAVEGDIILKNEEITLMENPETGENRHYAFITDKKAFNIVFEGRLYMEFFTVNDVDGDGEFDEGTDTIGERAKGFNAGYISSDGKEATEVMIKLQDGFDLDEDILVILTAIDANEDENGKATIRYISLIESVKTDVYWEGISISLSGSIELGAGVGIDIAKIEIFVKANISFAFTLGVYDAEKDEYKPAVIDEFGLSAGIGFRIVFLFFDYEQDLINYFLQYDKDEGWTHGWSALGGKFGGSSELSALDRETIDVYIKTPSQVRASVYGNNVNGTDGEMTEQAYTSNTADFQVSGYGASVNAFKLVGDVETGYEYQIVTVGDVNYVVYTGTNSDAEAAVDNTELWLSKLEETDDVYGLVNPIAGNGTSSDKYIAVDGDGTGDLDFYAWADEDGKSINVTWVSYHDKTAAPVRPAGTPYGDMTAENYDTIDAPEVPAAVSQPAREAYYLTEQEYNALAEAEKSNYAADVAGYYHTDYDSLASAETAYGAALDAYNAYETAKEDYDAYAKWYDYFSASDVKKQIVDASQNTVVKYASFDTTDVVSDGFTAAAELSDSAAETYYFLPKSAGEASVYAQSVLYSKEDLAERFAEYEDYLDDVLKLDSNASDPNEYLEASKQFRLNYQKSFLEVYGGNSRLTVTVPGKTLTNNVMYVSLHQQDGNGVAADQTHEILTNIDLAEIDGTYYLAYVTSQDFFEKSGTKYTDSSSISRFYLRTFTIDDTGMVEWGTPYLLRSVVNFEEDSTKDGVYSNGSLVKAYQDAYIANVNFLDGKIGDKLAGEEETFYPFATVEEETFLLFEMNGSTYVIKEDSLKSIVGPTNKGVISPFFTVEQTHGDKLTEDATEGHSSNKSEVVIGADGEGNVAAVYTSSIPGTTNNAIYIAYWDPENGAWSDGVMLAMNYMDVYERSVANGWDAAATEAAYLDETLGGGMTSLSFSGMQLALGRAPAAESMSVLSADGATASASVDTAASGYAEALASLGITIPENEDEMEAFAEEISSEEMYALSEQLELLGVDTDSRNSDAPELLILTQGALTELWEYEVDGQPVIAAKNAEGEDTAAHAKVGVYAISYGKGGQQVGNAAIRFGYNEFTVGSELYAAVSFKNVGDAAIRGSVDQPITVSLMVYDADGAPQTLTSWQITQSIGAGQTVELLTDTAYCAPLASSLGDGDYFYITLSEHEYADTPYTYNSSNDVNCSYTFNVADKPELAVESLDAEIVGVTDDGDARVETSFDVTNRGMKTAEEVYVQFSYVSGYDDEGNEIYSPLDLTDSDIYVSQQKLITDDMSVLGTNNLANGIIYLGTDDKFYTDDYYITKAAYDAILARYYSTAKVDGWEMGTYEGKTYYYDKLYYTSAYAAYTAGQEAVSGWSDGGNGYYYNNEYKSYTDAKNAADEARKAEYVLTAAQYNALSDAEKESWKQAADNESFYIPTGYNSYAAAYAAYELALADDTQDIKGNYYRTVEGEIRVAPDKFLGNLTGSLNIKVEVFSASSNANSNVGLHVSDHADEYHSINNYAEKQLEQRSFVNGAAKIVIARGSEHTLPIEVRTTTGAVPVISVVEVEDGTDDLGTLYYTADSDTDGVAATASGSITVVGRTLGEGVIHIIDSATNTTYPIAYVVAEEGSGVNIYNDDAQFTFYNADGTLFDEDKLDQSWSFKDISSWTEAPAVPYLSNLSIGEKGASFTFDTKASKFSFDLIGNATVKSNKFPGQYVISNDGKTAPPTSVEIDFGNDTQITHTVTVTITSETAYFDTVHLTYEGEYTPNDDSEAPGLYFSRSFPTAGSVKSGETVTLTVYAVDESGLQSMMFNNVPVDSEKIVKSDNGLWSYTFDVSANEDFTVSATDTNGNTTNRSIGVDWFGEDETSPYGKAPALSVSLDKVVGEEKEDVTDSTALTDVELAAGGYIYIDAAADEDTVSYFGYDGETSSFKAREGDVADKLTTNGYYMVRAESIDSYGTWSAYIFALDCIEATPEIRISQSVLTAPNGVELSFVATKDEESTSKLESVTVNDIDLLSGITTQSASYSGSFTTRYGGKYTFKAVDSKNVTGVTSVDIAVPVDISGDAVFAYVNAWGQPEGGKARYGEVTIDFSKITGGDYANTASVLSVDDYYGSYEFVVVSAEDIGNNSMPEALTDGEDSWLTALSWTDADHDDVITVDGLEVLAEGDSEYAVIIRDKQNPNEYSTMAVHKFTLTDNAVNIIEISALLASSETTSDGKVYLTVENGATGSYEFAILPMAVDPVNSTEENTVYIPLTADDFMKDDVVWQLADFDGEGNTVTLEGLGAGTYVAAVRALYTDSTELTALAKELVNAENSLTNVQNELANAIDGMMFDISAAHAQWGTASDNAETAKTTHDELFAKLEGGDTTVTSEAVDDAYDAWQAAVAEENAAKAAYTAEFVGIDDAALTQILELRTAWQTADADDEAAAREAYEAAVLSFCSAYQQTEYAQRIADANTALTDAENAYNTASSAALAESKAAYADNSAYWDGMLLSNMVSVIFGAPATVELSSTSTRTNRTIGIVDAVAGGGTAYDGGDKVYYQFALLPVDSKNDAVDYTGNMQEIGNLDLDWQFADDLAGAVQEKSFTSLGGGWYQVFVRVVYDPDITDSFDVNGAINTDGGTDTLAALKTAYAAAEAAATGKSVRDAVNNALELYKEYQNSGNEELLNEYLAAINNDVDVLAARDAWLGASEAEQKTAYNAYKDALHSYFDSQAALALAQAKDAYTELLNQLSEQVELAYTQNPANYDTAAFDIINVSVIAGTVVETDTSAIENAEETEDTVIYIIEEDMPLTDDDKKDIYNDNKEKDVVLIIGDREVFVLKDILTDSDEVSDVVTAFEGGNGNVVELTMPDGGKKIVPICLVEDGKVLYTYIGEGTYAVIQKDSSFSDIGNHWAKDNIIFGANRALFKGVTENSFAPDGTMTRAMMATLVYRLAGEPKVSGEMSFADVASGTWYYDAVLWGYQNKVIMGVSDTRFDPDGYITREQMVTLIFRYLDAEGFVGTERSDISGYGDSESVSEYAREAFSWSNASGIVVGTDKNLLMPKDNATRAQIAAITERVIRYILK